MHGEIKLSDDVAGDFAQLLDDSLNAALASGTRSSKEPFRFGCSGGASGVACIKALAARTDVTWSDLACYFVDERCVDPTSSDANQAMVKAALGPRVDELAGFYPMDCSKGADSYDQLLANNGPLDFIQLGCGPDGHTASLFPGSLALDAPPGRLVVANVDPSGHNPFERLTLTYQAIGLAPVVVIAVMGASKADALAQIVSGVDLPVARVQAARLIWLCDHEAGAGLPSSLRR